MDKRYQVFVSSTFKDLEEERQEVMQALLELDCMPAGMELFPAANEDQWTLIKKVIDDCDYYIVIIGGRYGSIGLDGLSYTEMEYRYALDKQKPIIAFLHKNPGELPSNRTEEEKEGKEKLNTFRNFAQKKMVRFWSTPSELGSVVSRSIINLIKTNPAIGWVKANMVPDESSLQEILKLKRRIEDLENQLQESSSKAPEGTELLSQGEDTFEISYSFKAVKDRNIVFGDIYKCSFITSWNDIFYSISPLMIDEISEEGLREGINLFIRDMQKEDFKKDDTFKKYNKYGEFKITNSEFQTIKVQLRALGLILKSKRARSVKDTGTYWSLTPYGDNVMTKLRAIRKIVQ